MSLNIQPRAATTGRATQTFATEKPLVKSTIDEALRQQSTTETPPAEAAATPAPEKKDDFLSPKFAALARQEKQIRQERDKLKAEKEAFEREKGAQLNGYIPKDKLKSDFLGALEMAGTSYDEATQALLSAPQGQVDPVVRQLQSELAALKQELGGFRKTQEETQTTAYKQALDTIRHKASGILGTDPQFEVLKFLNSTDEEGMPGLSEVVSYIEKEFKENGVVPSELEAAQFLENQHTENFLRFLEIPKLRKLAAEKLAPAEAPSQEPAQEKQPAPQQQQIKTLTNAVASTSPRRFTEKERVERAILAAKGLLKD